MNIAICDDNKKELHNIAELCDNVDEVQINCWKFPSSISLINFIKENGLIFEIYILDILMPQKNGIQLAEDIRTLDHNAIVIFITMCDRYVMDAFDIKAYQYIQKRNFKDFLPKTIIKAYNELLENRKYFNFRYNKVQYKLKNDDITYLQKHKRTMYIHTNQQLYQCNMTMSDALAQLDLRKFVKISVGTIVNMNYINKIDTYGIHIFERTEILNISRGLKMQVKALYNQYKIDNLEQNLL